MDAELHNKPDQSNSALILKDANWISSSFHVGLSRAPDRSLPVGYPADYSAAGGDIDYSTVLLEGLTQSSNPRLSDALEQPCVDDGMP